MRERFERFTTSISSISMGIRRIKNIEMKKLGLREKHVECIYLLADYPAGLTRTQIAELNEMDRSAVIRCMDQLEEKGLVYMEEAGSRKITTSWHLTDKGYQTARLVSSRIDEAVDAVGSFLSKEERKTLYKNLDRIVVNLEDYIRKKEEE